MRVIIEFDCDNAAFSEIDGNGTSGEIARILRELAEVLEISGLHSERPLFDVNGNRVGEFRLVD